MSRGVQIFLIKLILMALGITRGRGRNQKFAHFVHEGPAQIGNQLDSCQ